MLPDMDKAVAALEEASGRGEKIAVYGDYDVDGVTATAILIRYLRSRGAECQYYIPDRMNEGYGLNTGAIRKLAEDGCRLMVTVDSGITAVEETLLAQSLGMGVVITDHQDVYKRQPLTRSATERPNSFSSVVYVALVSSRQSWSRPATMESVSMPSSARMPATVTGWMK